MPKPTPQPVKDSEVRDLALRVIKKAKFPLLATMDGQQPRLRPVSPVHVEGFTIYIANLASYRKTKQIQQNPRVELCYLDVDHNQVRITGIAEIVKDRNLIQTFWRKNRLLEHYLGTIDNPELIVYKIAPTKVLYMQEWALEYMEVEVGDV